MADLHMFGADSRYIGLPIDNEFCPYTFHVYPSNEMKSGRDMKSTTNNND
jgi:hypothetical protein